MSLRITRTDADASTKDGFQAAEREVTAGKPVSLCAIDVNPTLLRSLFASIGVIRGRGQSQCDGRFGRQNPLLLTRDPDRA
jgi:hypothetical protein